MIVNSILFHSFFRLGGQKPRIHSSNELISSVKDFPPQLLVAIGDELKALEGSRVRLVCTYTGFPEPVISFSRNGRPLKPSEKVSLVGKIGSLEAMFNLGDSDNGNFTCSARNILGSDEVVSVFNVIGKSGSLGPSVTRTLSQM